MKFDTASQKQFERAYEYLAMLGGKHKVVEIKQVHPIRSLSQNKYLHVVLGFWGNEFGYTIEEAKTVFKRLNQDIFVYEKKGHKFVRSSADLTTEEMTTSIEKFREWSAKNGLHIPPPTDENFLTWANEEIKRNRIHL